MKKIKWLVAFLIVVNLLLGVIGCKDPEIHIHTYSEAWTKDETNHWHAATCEHKDEVIDKAKHTFGDWTTTKEATEEEGSRERSCTVCEYTVSEVIEKLEHTHTFATEWTSDSENHWYAATCEHTTEVSEKAEHTFGNWTITKEPTETESGKMQSVCEVCGETVTKELQPAPEGFVFVEAGTFQMGSTEGYDNNKPVHEVRITKPFYMGKYEVTQAEYEKYCSYTGSFSPSSKYGDGDNYPAYGVTWYDVLVYCNKRSIAEGLTPCYSISDSTAPEDWGVVPTEGDNTWDDATCDFNANGYRLPTEAEWEYAARAGDNTVDSLTYSGTRDVNELGDYAWYYDSVNDNTHEVGTKLPNAFGLYDMSGNVWEWCWNWFTNSYDTTTEGGSDPTGISAGWLLYRVLRGGSWATYSHGCAVSCRMNYIPDSSYYYIGFRVVRNAK